MLKTKEQRVADYKKSNKVRRAKIVTKAGYKTEEAYLNYLGTLLNKKSSKPPVKKVEPVEETLDMVIAFDTTGSMRSYIGDVRNHVTKVIPELFGDNPGLKMKIVAFGDYCDMDGRNHFGKAYQETQLTDNQNELIKFVERAQNTSGGDEDEFYELVMKKIIEETPWRSGKKAVLLIADSEPHPIGYTLRPYIIDNQLDWKELADEAAANNIQFDTLCIKEYSAKRFYRPLSETTGGVSMLFYSANKTANVFYAATAVRGSTASKLKFKGLHKKAIEDGDKELVATYSALSKKLL